MTSAFIHVVMRGTWDPKQCCTKDEHPVEAHHIQMVAESRAKSLGDMRSNAGFVFSVKMITLYGSKAVAVFPGVNARIVVEEPGKTPRRTRRLPRRELAEYTNSASCDTCHSPLTTMKGDHCPFCGAPQPQWKQNR